MTELSRVNAPPGFIVTPALLMAFIAPATPARLKVPWLRVAVDVLLLAAVNVTVLVPSLVSTKFPDTTPVTRMFPVPPSVAAAPRARVPCQEALPPELVSEPVLAIPGPRMLRASIVPREKPLRSRAPPAATVVPVPTVPKGVFVAPPLAPSLRVPKVMVVAPV